MMEITNKRRGIDIHFHGQNLSPLVLFAINPFPSSLTKELSEYLIPPVTFKLNKFLHIHTKAINFALCRLRSIIFTSGLGWKRSYN